MNADPVVALLDAIADPAVRTSIGRLHMAEGRSVSSECAGGRWWLLYVHRGRCRVVDGIWEYPLTPGMLVLFGAPQAVRLVDGIGRGFRAVRLPFQCAAQPPRQHLLRQVRAPHAVQVLTDLAALRGVATPAAARLRRSILIYLLELVRRPGSKAESSVVRTFTGEEIRRLFGAVAGGGNWDARRLARLMGCSVVHLRRRFRASMGVSPRDWLLSLRLRRGAERLSTSTEAIATIARDLGYSDQAQFSRQFSALYGVSPRSFRAEGGSNWVDLRIWGDAKRARRTRPPGGRGGGARSR